jgi:hypothetical protein
VRYPNAQRLNQVASNDEEEGDIRASAVRGLADLTSLGAMVLPDFAASEAAHLSALSALLVQLIESGTPALSCTAGEVGAKLLAAGCLESAHLLGSLLKLFLNAELGAAQDDSDVEDEAGQTAHNSRAGLQQVLALFFTSYFSFAALTGKISASPEATEELEPTASLVVGFERRAQQLLDSISVVCADICATARMQGSGSSAALSRLAQQLLQMVDSLPAKAEARTRVLRLGKQVRLFMAAALLREALKLDGSKRASKAETSVLREVARVVPTLDGKGWVDAAFTDVDALDAALQAVCALPALDKTSTKSLVAMRKLCKQPKKKTAKQLSSDSGEEPQSFLAAAPGLADLLELEDEDNEEEDEDEDEEE